MPGVPVGLQDLNSGRSQVPVLILLHMRVSAGKTTRHVDQRIVEGETRPQARRRQVARFQSGDGAARSDGRSEIDSVRTAHIEALNVELDTEDKVSSLLIVAKLDTTSEATVAIDAAGTGGVHCGDVGGHREHTRSGAGAVQQRV